MVPEKFGMSEDVAHYSYLGDSSLHDNVLGILLKYFVNSFHQRISAYLYTHFLLKV